jgi:phosphatidylserine decarboxylase
LRDRLQLFLIKSMPKHTLSRLIGTFARSPKSRFLIPWFMKTYKIDMRDVEKPVEQYKSLTEFFTRRLVSSARPIDPTEDGVVSPVDGTIAQMGTITDGKLIQAKGVTFTVSELLADASKQNQYEGGWFVTIYLSPTDYHRIHMPVSGTPTQCTYVPGTLFPVNTIGVKHVPGLFAKNERVVTVFTAPWGEFTMVKVGATIVGSVVVDYAPVRTNVRRGVLIRQNLDKTKEYVKGEECARFEFGSTVILLFPPGRMIPDRALFPGKKVKMGERIGRLVDVRLS